MKTDDLIAALALDTRPVRAGQLERELLIWMAPGCLAALSGVLFWLGLRPDLSVAVLGPTFWAKVAYGVALATGGFWLLDRLGRPGADTNAPLIQLIVTLIGVALLAGFELASLPTGARLEAIMGRTAPSCPVIILLLSALAGPFIFIAARRLAPTSPTGAGAAAGLLTASLCATLYGLHCPESTASFVAIWYTLGIALFTAAGAVVGRFLFRW